MTIATESAIINRRGDLVLATPKPPLTNVLGLVGASAMPKSKTIPQLTPKQIEYFWSKVEVPYQPSCCWEWTGTHTDRGYGRPKFSGRLLMAHRIAYTLLIGRIPEGLTIDHLCRNHRCVNPDHLQAVSIAVNTRRGYSNPGHNAKKTHCKHGHEFTPENTYWGKTGRTCRACNHEHYLRAKGVTARNLTRTHCPQGHERTPENTYVAPNGDKSCRICRTIRARASAQRQREARGPVRPKTHCKRGHEFTPENTYRNPSKPNERYCRACIRLREQDYIRPSKRQKVEAA